MTLSFATPQETDDWLATEIVRLGLVARHRPGPSAPAREWFLWPVNAPDVQLPLGGVAVWSPEADGTDLLAGDLGFKPSAYEPALAAVGSGLRRSLLRSLRQLAPIPLYATSYKGDVSGTPAAWGSPAAVSSGLALRQFRGGTVTFAPGSAP